MTVVSSGSVTVKDRTVDVQRMDRRDKKNGRKITVSFFTVLLSFRPILLAV